MGSYLRKISEAEVWTHVLRAQYSSYRDDEGLTLETSAFLPFTVANLRFQLSCLNYLLYSPTDAAPQFL